MCVVFKATFAIGCDFLFQTTKNICGDYISSHEFCKKRKKKRKKTD